MGRRSMAECRRNCARKSSVGNGRTRMKWLCLVSVAAASTLLVTAQRTWTNLDEAKVPSYSLPGVLVMSDGTRVTSAKMWESQRRPEILELYRKEIYGRPPSKVVKLDHDTPLVDRQALGGKAVRKQVTLRVPGKPEGPKMRLLMYLPANAK